MTTLSEHPLEAAIARSWPPPSWRDLHVVLAVSGGPDSVALLRAVLSRKQREGGPGRIFVAHLHHGLRGPAADEDQAWLENLCSRQEIPLEVGRADLSAAVEIQGDGYEAAARKARYEFLCATAERLGARLVAVGHTADDQVETVLHRILRGTGLAGLAGMPRVRPLTPSVALVRPLLEVRRRDVLAYLAAIGQEYRTDATNNESRWTRNRLRNDLLPIIRSHFNPDADQALRRLAQQAAEAQRFIADAAVALAVRSVITDAETVPQCVRIDCRPLSDQPALLIGEVCKTAWQQVGWPLQAMGFDEWQQLAAMVQANCAVTAVNLPGDIHARREDNFLILQAGTR